MTNQQIIERQQRKIEDLRRQIGRLKRLLAAVASERDEALDKHRRLLSWVTGLAAATTTNPREQPCE